jgi:drug/metabolite transporter (DMT)-like permease
MSPVAWILILMMGVQSVVIYILSMVALKHVEASKASIITSIEPAVAVIIAYIVAAQTITGIQSVGIALVFLGLMVLGLLEKPAPRSSLVPPEKRP